MKLKGKYLLILIGLFMLVISFLGVGIEFYTDLLWFKNLDLTTLFWTVFKAKITVRMVVGILFSLGLFINLFFTKKKLLELIERLHKKEEDKDDIIELNPSSSQEWLKFITKGRVNLFYLIFSLLLGFFFSSISSNSWELILKFFNSTLFGVVDPLFNKDLSFYIFKFPFYQLVYQLLSTLIVISGLVVAVIYFFSGGRVPFWKKIESTNQAKSHLSILLGSFFLVKAWGYRLSMFKLLYSNRGVAFGASYTDVHAQLFGLKVLAVVAIILAVLIFINIFLKRTKLILLGIAGLFIASILLNNIYPGFVQQYQVEPNEIAKESKYIKYNIQFTQQAYNLDNIVEREFNVKEDLNYDDIKNNEITINNIRLWDNRPLQTTYSQLQGIRSYYSFNDVDVDRYKINNKWQQVMLGARELNQKLLSQRAQTWVNEKLNYTHGFGLVMSPVSKVVQGGLPEFSIKDIPPESRDFEINEPRIYYGELTDEYVIANTNAKEFDYPAGDKNKYVSYKGSGGVKLDSLVKKIAFSFKYGTLKLLLNNDITSDSRLMFNRNIKNRVRKVAPFLMYDRDPYLVLGETGKLYWIQDAYTVTGMYPYSEPQSWGNYIRNSVKVVINAYTGQIKFYIVDDKDPLIKTYNKIFPDLFSSFNQMPDDLKEHLRYPQDLFSIQAQLYSNYHMEDPTVFYNKEDMWNLPQENYAGESITIQPYYMLMKLPEDKRESFLIMMPFTPVKKNNMIAWLAAKSDLDEYGKLILYKFPKRRLVYGPMQIEARVDQNSEISKELSLWNQRGSRVIRGNLLTIPIKNSILYVEPVYLQAEQSQLPELRRVIVSYGERVAMESNLNLALRKIFNITEEEVDREDVRENIKEDIGGRIGSEELLDAIVVLYKKAQRELKEGNWSEYGKVLKEFEEKLNLLQQRVEE